MTLVLFKRGWSCFGAYTLRQAQDDKGFNGKIILEWFWMPACAGMTKKTLVIRLRVTKGLDGKEILNQVQDDKSIWIKGCALTLRPFDKLRMTKGLTERLCLNGFGCLPAQA